ncbi:MAG: hypothetical protein JO031_16575 [Ktedonobacteraceae bacterium]|nr:hypothetical protein [Ktedonobacteraceae bacterium]
MQMTKQTGMPECQNVGITTKQTGMPECRNVEINRIHTRIRLIAPAVSQEILTLKYK